MACGSCGTGGCNNKGGCSSGGCNRLNVHDWLANLPFSDPDSNCKIIEVSFNNGSRKDYFKNTTLHQYSKGDLLAVEGVNGFDVGAVNLTGELVRLQLKKYKIDEKSPDLRKVLRRANEADLAKLEESKGKEKQLLIRSRAIARQLKLEMKMAEVELQADARKATFFYIADDRVDFRELIKLYASEFKVKVEMRQIGARQEAGKVGGIGSCGRELCCSTWLTDFKSVNTNAARYQNLSINQTKLSGQCGRLKCCLNFELDTYIDALQFFPNDADTLQTQRGRAFLVKKDIFKNLMWYAVEGSSAHIPLTIESAKKIKALNRDGVFPDELKPAEVATSKPKEVEPEYADLVGQISLRSLERNSKKRRDREQGNRQRPQQGNAPQRNDKRPASNNQPRPQQNNNRPQQGGNRPAQQGGQQNNEPRQNNNNPQQNRPQNNNQQRNNNNPQQRNNNNRGNNRPNKPFNKPNTGGAGGGDAPAQ
jgi:cell fate regulator YaaT (PSP1 superfamily)